jgi:hypothetical protein
MSRARASLRIRLAHSPRKRLQMVLSPSQIDSRGEGNFMIALRSSTIALAALALTACASQGSAPTFSQAALPAAVQVPAGNRVALETVGVGEITYECRAKANAAGQFEWVLVAPVAVLNDRDGRAIGKYYGPPASWESNDGSKVTGAQVAVSPAAPGNIPLQLVKANPATGSGAMSGVTFIQRVDTRGGVAPVSPCDGVNLLRKVQVKYQADYILYKAM